MSNKVTLQKIKFVDLTNNDVSFGFCLYDSYDRTFNNLYHLESDGENKFGLPILPESDLEFFQLVLKATTDNAAIRDLLEYIEEEREGIEINHTWYDWEEISNFYSLKPGISMNNWDIEEQGEE